MSRIKLSIDHKPIRTLLAKVDYLLKESNTTCPPEQIQKNISTLQNISDSILLGSSRQESIELELFAVEKQTAEFLQDNTNPKIDTPLSRTIQSILRAATIISKQEIKKLIMTGASKDNSLLRLMVNNQLKIEEKEKDRQRDREEKEGDNSLEDSLKDIYDNLLDSPTKFNGNGNENPIDI